MKDETADEYAERIWRVIDFIHGNLDRELSVEFLARVAGLSKFQISLLELF